MTTEYKKDPEYGIIHLATGRIEPIDVYEAKERYSWERVYAKTLVDMLDMTGESQTKIIAYLIKHKDYKNVVAATVRKIADETNCSTRTVQRTLKQLLDSDFLHRLQNGLIMFSPHVMRTGRDKAGMAVVRRWNDAHKIEE
jgi:predicted transcriptional regulator